MYSRPHRDEKSPTPASSPHRSPSSQAQAQPTPRRSARTTPLRRQSSMVIPPSDSRKAVPSDVESESENVRKGSKRRREETEDESALTSKNQPKKSKSASSLAVTSKQTKKTVVPTKKSNNPTQSNSTASTSKRKRLEVNLIQDSEDEHVKVQQPKKKPKKVTKQLEEKGEEKEAEVEEVDPYDPIKDYFEPNSVRGGKDKPEGPYNSWVCKYCPAKARGGGGSYSNLYAHRDGSTQAGKSGKPGCQGRDQAIEAGCVLPPTVCERRKKQEQLVQTSMNSFVQKVNKFSNPVLNQMVGLWAVSTSQPWLRIEDKALRACFRYANPHAQLFGRTWLANFAHRVYLGQRETVISDLKALDSKYGLILDAWTSPRNRYGFISASVTYINSEWKFVSRHLSMKMIAWHHKGEWLAEPLINVLVKHDLYSKMVSQTHDSGSNNDTCARAMQARLKKVAEENYEEFTFDESTDRVRCAGHKIALTVNGGLQALGIEAPPPPLVKSTILGNFPLDEHTLATIPEEEEDGEESSKSQQTPLNNQDNSDYKDEDTDLSNLPGKEVSNEWYQVIDGPFDPPPAVEVEQPATNRNEANEVHALTLKGIL